MSRQHCISLLNVTNINKMLKCMPQNEDCSHYSTMFLHMLKVKTVQREKMVILDSKLGNSCFRRPSKFEDMVLCLKIRDL